MTRNLRSFPPNRWLAVVALSLVAVCAARADEALTTVSATYPYPAGWDFSGAWSPSNVPVSMGDFNGDGRADFVRFGATYMYIFLSDGAGGFTPVLYQYPSGWDFGFDQNVWRTVVGDVDGDGRADVIEVGATETRVFLSRLDGTPGVGWLPSNAFATATYAYPTGWNFTGAWSPSSVPVSVGDFNGDGRADFVRFGPLYMYIFLSDGAGGFTPRVYEYPSGWNFGVDQDAWHTVVGDFDGDGRADVLEVGATETRAFLSRLTGVPPAGDLPASAFATATYAYPSGWDFTGAWSPSSVPVSVGDFNGDGRTDFVRFGPTYMHIFLSDGAGGFTPSVYHYPSGWDFGFDQSVWHTLVGDFDGDGRTDMIEVSSTYVRPFLSRLTGSPVVDDDLPLTTFSLQVATYPSGWDLPLSAYAENIADLDGNGRSDLLDVGATDAASMRFFFAAATTIAVPPVSGEIDGTVTLTAILKTVAGAPLAGKTMAFTLDGTSVGTATTDATGTATLSAVALGTIGAGSYPTGVAASFAGDADAESAAGTAALTVLKKIQTLTIAPVAPQTYGNAPVGLVVTPGESGAPVSIVATGSCGVSGTTVTIAGAGTCAIAATEPGDATYEPAATGLSFTIAAAPLTIAAVSQTRPYDAPNPPLVATYTGFVNGDTAASLNPPASLSTTADSLSPSGTYPIVVSGAANPNYVITFVNGTLTIQGLRPIVVAERVALQALLPGASRRVGEELRDAIRDLDRSLDPSLWLDDSHLTRRGAQVFERTRQAVEELVEIERLSHASAPFASIASTLVGVDRALASVALETAGVGPAREARAERDLALGDRRATDDRLGEAINRYLQAWIRSRV